jgi:hypothetical protein
MVALESSEQNRASLNQESAVERYGFSITFIDDNSVHVRDILGKEIAFEYPMDQIGFDRYDKFIQRMQDSNVPPPPIEDVVLTVKRPLADVLKKPMLGKDSNSPVKLTTLEKIAEQHGLTTDEMKWMYRFAQDALYGRFKSRLRPNASRTD